MEEVNALHELGLQRGTGRLAQVQKKYTFFPTGSAVGLLGAAAPKTPIFDKKIRRVILTKRTKRKHVLFTQEQWKLVCRRAERLRMKPATYLRNMSLHKEWKNVSADDFCLPMKIINHIGTDMNMIIRVAENINPEHLEKLRELKKRFEEYRNNFIRYYSQLMNRG